MELLERILRELGFSEKDRKEIFACIQEEIEQLKAENASLSKERDELKVKSESLGVEVVSLTEDCRQLDMELTGAVASRQELLEAIHRREGEFQSEIGKLKAENAALSKEIERLKESDKGKIWLTEEVRSLGKQLQTEKEVTKKLQESYEKLEVEKKGLRGECQRLNEVVAAHEKITKQAKLDLEQEKEFSRDLAKDYELKRDQAATIFRNKDREISELQISVKVLARLLGGAS